MANRLGWGVMRGALALVLLVLLLPASSAWSLPDFPTVEGEWIVVNEDGWSHSDWVALRSDGLEPLRHVTAKEVLVWGDHGTYQLESEPVLRGGLSTEGYRVVLEPRLPSRVQWNIIRQFDVGSLQLAGSGSPLPTSFEVKGVEPMVFDSIPGVFWVEPLLETKARNSVASSIMEQGETSGHPAWAVGLNGSGVVIASADSGIELDHGCFRDGVNSTGIIGDGHRKVILVNTTIDDGDHSGQTDYRHGTHIAGSLACHLYDEYANGTVASGGTSVAHGARLLIQDVVNESGWSEPTVDWLLAEALENGAIIHSDSWGDDIEAYTLRSSEFDIWHREVPWSLAFIAPGNNANRFYEPANARNVVSVGGSLHNNSSDLYWSSSHGPTEEGLRGNFIVAPAVSISSASADGNITSFNDDMRTSTGTSMSTPLAASLTAVIQQMVQDGWMRGSHQANSPDSEVGATNGFTPSGPLLRALLALSAESMEGGQQNSNTVGPAPGPLQGWGRPNLSRLTNFDFNDSSANVWVHDSFRMNDSARQQLAATWLAAPGTRPLEQVVASLWDGEGAMGPFLAQGENISWNLSILQGQDLEIFLSFNQRPFGSVSDDLNLVVRLPNGTTIESGDVLEGTEVVRILASELIGVARVTVEVHAEVVGVGNHSGVLGSDGDKLGFALAIRGAENIPVFSLEVVNGTGSGIYTEGTVITINASEPPVDYHFSHWNTSGGEIDNHNLPTTNYTMVNSSAVVTAVFEINEIIDSDEDGVPDNEDICDGHDDAVDSDSDGIPDGCDDTPQPPPPVVEPNGNSTGGDLMKPLPERGPVRLAVAGMLGCIGVILLIIAIGIIFIAKQNSKKTG